MKSVIRMWACLLALLLGNGCGEDAAEYEPLTVRLLSDLSGPTSFVGRAFHAGRVDHLEEINRAGGLSGRLVEYGVADSRYDPGLATQAFLMWKAGVDWNEVVTVFGYGTPGALALDEYVRRAEVPFFSKSGLGQLASPKGVVRAVKLEDGSIKVVEHNGAPYHYPIVMDYSSAARATIDFIANSGSRSIAFVGCPDNSYCSEPLEVARAYARGVYDMQVHADLLVELDDTALEIGAKVSAYLAAGEPPDWIWLGTPHTTSARIIEAFRDEDLRLMANVWSMDEQLDQDSNGAARGKVYGLVGARMFGDMYGSLVMSEVVSAHSRHSALEEYENVYYVMGYATVAVWSIAVERVIAAGKEISRESIREELDAMQGVNTGGLLKPVSYQPEDHRPSMAAELYTIDWEGKLRQVTRVEVERRAQWLGW